MPTTSTDAAEQETAPLALWFNAHELAAALGVTTASIYLRAPTYLPASYIRSDIRPQLYHPQSLELLRGRIRTRRRRQQGDADGAELRVQAELDQLLAEVRQEP